MLVWATDSAIKQTQNIYKSRKKKYWTPTILFHYFAKLQEWFFLYFIKYKMKKFQTKFVDPEIHILTNLYWKTVGSYIK
jgi:hypothetical protein